ncbi:hypothetical protein RHECNPAF_2530079 [Rhizobium etli CNPAF512]|nr:hypothetical protein RHECNPAF_2530079 [Rhizobium etli CNPAF512]
MKRARQSVHSGTSWFRRSGRCLSL